jgi:hypothetical protein
VLHVPPVYQALVLIVPMLVIDGHMLSEHFLASLGHLIPPVICFFVAAHLLFIDRRVSPNEDFLRRTQGPFFGHSLVQVSTLKTVFRLHQIAAVIRKFSYHVERYIAMFEVGANWREWERLTARERRSMIRALKMSKATHDGVEVISLDVLGVDSNGFRFLSNVCRGVQRITRRTVGFHADDGRVMLTSGARDGILTVIEYVCQKKGGRR